MNPRIQKAVLPIAGKAARMMPLSSVLPKALLPLVDSANQCRPVLHWIAAAAAAAGIDELAIVLSPAQEPLVRQYLQAARSAAPALPDEITLIVQERPAGFGDAVGRAQAFVDNEPFLLLLGDHLQLAAPNAPPPLQQLLLAYEKLRAPAALVAMQTVDESQLALVGVGRGEPIDANLFRCTALAEKPAPDRARAELVTPHLPPGRFLAHAGLYLLSPDIFFCLAELAHNTPPQRELQLADAQALLLRRRPADYFLCLLQADVLDIGTPENYAAAQRAFARK